jgi:hypothetical protein
MPLLDPDDSLRHIDPFNAEWVTALLIAIVAALAWANVSAPRKWRLLAHGMFSMRLAQQTLREEIDLRDRTFLGLLVVAAAVIALYLWQGLQLTIPGAAPDYPWLLGMVLLVLMGQAILLRALASMAASDRGIAEYLSAGYLVFLLTGLLLLPTVVLMAYRSPWRPVLLMVGAIILALLLLFRWVRGAWVGLGEGLPLRYIILYLCAAEAVPVLLIIHTWLPRTPLPTSP